MKKLAWLLVSISIGAFAMLVYTATVRTLSSLENVLLQFISLAAGLAGSFIFGRQSVRTAASELIKSHAGYAFRRLRSLYRSLHRAADVIESAQRSESQEDHRMAFGKLEEIVANQLITADDALEDWSDIFRQNSEELGQKFKEIQLDETTEDKQ